MTTYNLFISHSWDYSDAYENLVALLDKAEGFSYRNYSVPKDDPVHDATNEAELKEAITAQMKSCSVVLILAGVYSTYSKWINIEIDLAQEGFSTKKPIIGVIPWAQTNVSTTVSDAADDMVHWNTKSIVDAIKDLAG